MSSGRELQRATRRLSLHASAWGWSQTGLFLHCLVWGVWESRQQSQSWPGLSGRIKTARRATREATAVSQVWLGLVHSELNQLIFHEKNVIYLCIFFRALQARVSRQVMMNVDQEESDDDDDKEQERISLADLKHRGKKKTVAPIIRTKHAMRS